MAATLLQTRIETQGSTFLQSSAAWLEHRLELESERIALWVPVFFGLGIGLWFALPLEKIWFACLFFAASVMVLGGLIGIGRRIGRAFMVAGCLVLLGMIYIWARALFLAAPTLAYPVTTEFSARIEKVEALVARGKVRMIVAPIERPDLPARLRITATPDQLKLPNSGTAMPLNAGEYIGLRARLTPPPRAAITGGYDFSRRAWFEQIGGVGSALGPVMRAQVPQKAATSAIRADLTRHIHQQLEGSVGGIAAALVTGDRGAITPEDDEAMRRSGLAHLLSISGLHVTAVIGFSMLAALRIFGLIQPLAYAGFVVASAAAFAALVGGGYTLLAGAEVPTLRSFIAAMLVLFAILLGRDAVTLRLIAAGATLILIWRPEALVGASFQLSFAAVTTIVALHEHPKVRDFLARRDERMIRRWGRALAGLMLTGVAVELALMPIGLFHFHKAGIYGALANMIAIPLTTFIVMPLEALALFFDIIGAGAPFWWLGGQAIQFLIDLAHTVANWPESTNSVAQMPISTLALFILGGFWMLIWRTNWRWLGLLPVIAGLALTNLRPAADLLISADGKQVAARVVGDQYALLRLGRGGFTADMMLEAAGSDRQAIAIKDWPSANCNEDFCRWTMEGQGRLYQILASSSSRMAEYDALINACNQADILITDRNMPKACQPKLLLGRDALAESGGAILHLAEQPIWLSRPSDQSDHPWRNPEQVSGNDEL